MKLDILLTWRRIRIILIILKDVEISNDGHSHAERDQSKGLWPLVDDAVLGFHPSKGQAATANRKIRRALNC
eukprot:6187462-Pleurochrysis_carterae.AAC.3